MKKCPVCNVFMNEVSRVGVLIDVCPECRGTWLDRGELDKILERLRDAGREWEEDYKRHPDHYKKKKSKWKEIFDIFD